MVLTFTHTNALCPASNDGTATVVVTGGTAPYTYQWDDFGSQVTAVAVNLIPATYRVVVTDATGEMVSGTVGVGFINRICPQESVLLDYVGDTVAFSKSRNRWITRYPFNPEYYGAIRNEIVSFKDGELWLHEASDLFNYFYGVQEKSTLTIVTNKVPLKVKYFNAIALSSNTVWSATSMDIVPNIMYPSGMNTYLSATKFRTVQGKHYSEIMRDTNTPGFPTPAQALINGRPMTGQAMKVTLENTDATEAVLLSIEFIYTYSEKS